MTFETEWTGGNGAVDRSQQLSAALAAAAHTLADSVARDAGGAETPGSISEHVVTLRAAGEDLARAFESLAGQVADMAQRNILISVTDESEQSQSAAQAVVTLRAAADGARQLSALIAQARAPLLDLTLTDEAESAVWERYE
ncbi:hypothetical protein [Actinospica robiniae]|uniref:hypothetical protein n=1 Tax=Actinospica robiniae TaxID=304901 RepID=UPI00055219F2|nr:hypothetical protein [Actinospica robiniae]